MTKVERLPIMILLMPAMLRAQTADTKTMVYYDSQNRKLTSPTGAAWALETKYIDSVRAMERVYYAPQKVREQASFSNIRLRQRDGETVVYYDDGTVKLRTHYQAVKQQEESFSYYPNGKLRRHDQYENQKRVRLECFDAAGRSMSCDTL